MLNKKMFLAGPDYKQLDKEGIIKIREKGYIEIHFSNLSEADKRFSQT